MTTGRAHGTVKRLLLEKGYGFITGPDGDVFMHRSGSSPEVFDGLLEGVAVSYISQSSNKGKRAMDVRREP